MSFGRAFRLVALILGGVAVVLAVVCGALVVRTRTFLAESSTAPGQVVGLVSHESCDHHQTDHSDRDCSTVYAPRIRFTTADGRQVEYVSDTSAAPPTYDVGEAVEVRYRRSDPEDARINSLAGIWVGSLITGGLAVVFAAVCGIWIRLAVKFRAA